MKNDNKTKNLIKVNSVPRQLINISNDTIEHTVNIILRLYTGLLAQSFFFMPTSPLLFIYFK